MAKQTSGFYKGVPAKDVPYWSQPGTIKRYVEPKQKVTPKSNPYKRTKGSKFA